jgi:hypothetical protein
MDKKDSLLLLNILSISNGKIYHLNYPFLGETSLGNMSVGRSVQSNLNFRFSG